VKEVEEDYEDDMEDEQPLLEPKRPKLRIGDHNITRLMEVYMHPV
jgi:hypothetical protein